MLSGENLREAGRTAQKDHPMGVTQIWLRGLSRGALGIPGTTALTPFPSTPLPSFSGARAHSAAAPLQPG